MRPIHVLATHLSVHDSLVALHLMRIASVDVAAMCMLLGNVGYAQPNTTQQHDGRQSASLFISLPLCYVLVSVYLSVCPQDYSESRGQIISIKAWESEPPDPPPGCAYEPW